MRQIAYVAEDGQIYSSDLDLGSHQLLSDSGEGPRPSDQQMLHNWPTWSPNGTRLAFFRFEVVGGEVRRSSVRSVAADGSDPRDLYVGAAGTAPIYMAWSPDSRRLAILVQEDNRLHLRVADADGRDARAVCRGAPLYFTWRADSQALVVHVGPEEGGAGPSRILWIDVPANSAEEIHLPRHAAASHRAPVWSAVMNSVLFAVGGEGYPVEIVAQSSTNESPVPIVRAGAGPAFLPSPVGRRLAYTSRAGTESPLYEGLWVFEPGQEPRRLISEPLLAFFWCPDGERVVWATGDVGNRTVGLAMLHVATGRQSELGFLRPTRDAWLLFSHFDQYAQSVALISADGSEILLSTSQAQERRNGSVPTVRRVLVRRLDDAAQEKVIASGRLAFWRPEPAQ